jgi:hypothetical protein
VFKGKSLHSPRPKKATGGEEQRQEHALHFFYIKGNVHKEFSSDTKECIYTCGYVIIFFKLVSLAALGMN